MSERTSETSPRRNPYLILGIPFGANATQANKAFAKASRAARAGTSVYSTEDFTWALHQVEHAASERESIFAHFRVPADPSVYEDGLESQLVPSPSPYPRRSQPDPGVTERLRMDAIRRLFGIALAEDQASLPPIYGI